ncbi:WhiB family transcriptional regulator [Mycobacterium lehmannii]|uniref:WhiB family transcriptional regulator n=1 Tax=Mycobacterium lehmannii TaxID=2048550 RepID=UPI003BF8D86B
MVACPRPPHSPADDRQWLLHARCRGLPTEIFFAAEGERGQRRVAREEQAKRVCRPCPVQPDCLRYALTAVEPWGIWGATTPTERQRLTEPAEPSGRAPTDARVAGSCPTGDRDSRKPV